MNIKIYDRYFRPFKDAVCPFRINCWKDGWRFGINFRVLWMTVLFTNAHTAGKPFDMFFSGSSIFIPLCSPPRIWSNKV